MIAVYYDVLLVLLRACSASANFSAAFFVFAMNSRREFFGFKIGTMTSSTDFDYIKRKYEKLLAKMVKKMHKYAAQYGGEIIL
jgi:hypothetical protein